MNSDTLERLIEALEARAWDGSWRGVLDAETRYGQKLVTPDQAAA